MASNLLFAGHAFTDADIFWDHDEADNMDELSPKLTPTFIAFLSTDSKGPGLDPASINILSRYGMDDISTMTGFSQLTLSEIFRSLTDTELQELPKRGLKRLLTYGSYISGLMTWNGAVFPRNTTTGHGH
jgi:hypothetical protein